MNKPESDATKTRAVLGLGDGDARPRPWRRRLAWGIAGVAILLGAYLYFFNGDETGARSYVTQPVSRGNLTVVVTATGSVQPVNKVDVSSELSGTVRRVLVDYNSVVKVGQTLAELDTDKLKATVDSSRAKLAQAQAKVAEAQATVEEKLLDFNRKKTLVAKQATSQQDLDAAKAAYDRAMAGLASTRADVGVAEADLRLNETNLRKACICSPINGIVLVRNVDPGQTVAASLQAPVLFSIAEDLKQMEVRVDVDEADVGQVAEGQGATFTVDAFPDRHFPAKVRMLRFASETVQGVVTYKAVLTVDNSELLLRPGMTATASVVVNQVNGAILVPNAALRFSPQNNNQRSQSFLQQLMPRGPRRQTTTAPEPKGPNRAVWVLRDGQPTRIAVVVGATDGKQTQILKGEIAPGDRVIVDAVAAAR
ncbi:MAG: efflux RND transporter periplasmic adaptor subunit [Rhodospirillaceae bacterium]|nr:efflux RND transporter periplasmic adaptor subunit [Rhodospirillaceae bacterium]